MRDMCAGAKQVWLWWRQARPKWAVEVGRSKRVQQRLGRRLASAQGAHTAFESQSVKTSAAGAGTAVADGAAS